MGIRLLVPMEMAFSCPLLAAATVVSSTMPVPTASTGRVRSTRTVARGSSTSIRAIAAWAAATTATMDDPFALFARPRTKRNLQI